MLRRPSFLRFRFRCRNCKKNGLVVEVHDTDDKEAEEFLDNEYRVLPCDKDGEDPGRNEREASEEAQKAYLKV
jgi:hypothetical protein